MKTEVNIFMSPFGNQVIAARQAIKSYFQKRISIIDSRISYEMFQVLYVLWDKNEINQQEIANTVQKGKASVTPLVDNLSRLNLVTRTEDLADRRNKIIALTKEGRYIEQKFEPVLNEFYGLFNAGIPENTIREMTDILAKMTKSISE